MKITLSIATYERTDYIARMSASLLASVDIKSVNVRIYDDCSPSLSLQDLWELFPYAKEIVKRERNLKADANMKQIFEDFLATDDDILLLADSDLVYRTGWAEFIAEALPQTDGILSLYDSRLHPFLTESNGQDFAPKAHLGAAGTAFSRQRVEDIVNANMKAVTYDWAWSELFQNKGYALMCCTNSYIQHIGIIGQNNKGAISLFDFSRTFYADNNTTSKILSQFINELVDENNRYYDLMGLGKTLVEMRGYDIVFQRHNNSFCKRSPGVSLLHYFKIKLRLILFSLLLRLK